jgi:ATP-dependent DNA helicase RecG
MNTLSIVLEQGEGQFIEFKESFDKSLASEIVAFANASGGKIYLGITDDSKLKGIDINNRLKSQIQDIARNCDPSIIISLDEIENVEFAIEYIKERVPVEFIIETAKRKEIPAYPEKAYREAIVNAIIHFDYFLGSNIAIEKFNCY